MSTQIPIWLLGRNVSAVTVFPQFVDTGAATTGLLTASAAGSQTLTGLVDEIDFNGAQTTESIVNLTSVRENEVPIENSDSIQLTEILRNGAGLSFLAKCWQTSDSADYAVVTVTRGASTWSFTGLMSSYSETIRKGKCVCRATFMMVDIGNLNANPVYTTA